MGPRVCGSRLYLLDPFGICDVTGRGIASSRKIARRTPHYGLATALMATGITVDPIGSASETGKGRSNPAGRPYGKSGPQRRARPEIPLALGIAEGISYRVSSASVSAN
jgi:hypothetical protein